MGNPFAPKSRSRLLQDRKPKSTEKSSESASVVEGATDKLVETTPQATEKDVPTEDKPDTVDEILASVGDDVDKAREALAAEESKSKPRKTLVKELNEIIEGK